MSMGFVRKNTVRQLAAAVSVGALALALAACGDDSDSGTSGSSGGSSGGSSATQKVTFMLDFGVDASTAGLAWAAQDGTFKDHGLDVDIQPGSGSEITEQTLEQGKADIGFVDLDVYLKHRLDGSDKSMAVWAYGNTPTTSLLSLDEYSTPQDLAGTKFATVSGSSGIQAVETVLEDNGMSKDDVDVVLLDYSVLYQSLFDKKVDSAEFHIGGDEGALIEARDQGLDPHVAPLADWGLVGYPQTLVVNADFLKDHPDAVKEFIAALAEANGAAASASDDDVVKALQGLDPTIEKEPISEGRKNLADLGSGSGPIDESVVQADIDRLEKTTGVSSDLKAADMFTNDYAAQ